MAALTTQAEVEALRDYYFKVEYTGSGVDPNPGVDQWSVVAPNTDAAGLAAADYAYSARIASMTQKEQDDLIDLLDTANNLIV